MSYIGDSDGVGSWNPRGITPTSAHTGIVEFGNPSAAVVTFYLRSTFNEAQSRATGQRVHNDVEYVRIQQPGEKEQVVDKPSTPTDRQRWPHQYRAFAEGRQQTPAGIPIDLLFPSHPSIADNMKAINIFTVEQLAGLSASGMDSLGMGAQDYVNYAKQYLEVAHRGVGFHQMQAELKSRDEEIRTLKHQMDMQRGQIDHLMQSMVNNVTGGRAILPTGVGVPPVPRGMLPPVPMSFDPQTAAINAAGPQAPAPVEAPKRVRRTKAEIEQAKATAALASDVDAVRKTG